MSHQPLQLGRLTVAACGAVVRWVSDQTLRCVGISTEMQATMFQIITFKQSGQSLVATRVAGLSTYVSDRTNGLTFLVDTGAEVSILPPSCTDRLRQQDNFSLCAINNIPIATFDT